MERVEGTKAEIYIEIIDLGAKKWKEFVTPNDDGSYTVFVNARLSYEMQCEEARHGIDHAEKQDFEKQRVQEIEAQAHGMHKKKEIDPEILRILEQAERQERELDARQQAEKQKRIKELCAYWRERSKATHERIERELRRYNQTTEIFTRVHGNYYEVMGDRRFEPD